MRQALAPLLFDDEELSQNRKERDAVKPAVSSKSAKKKKVQKPTKRDYLFTVSARLS